MLAVIKFVPEWRAKKTSPSQADEDFVGSQWRTTTGNEWQIQWENTELRIEKYKCLLIGEAEAKAAASEQIQ